MKVTPWLEKAGRSQVALALEIRRAHFLEASRATCCNEGAPRPARKTSRSKKLSTLYWKKGRTLEYSFCQCTRATQRKWIDCERARSMPARGWRRVSANAGCACMRGENCAATQFFPPPSSCFENRTSRCSMSAAGSACWLSICAERNFLPPISGLDRDWPQNRACANAVKNGVYRDLDFIEQDVCDPIAQTGNIVLFDLLHYLQPNEQSAPARTARAARRARRPAGHSRLSARRQRPFLADASGGTLRPSDDLEHESAAPFSDPRENLCRLRPRSVLLQRRAALGRTPFNNHSSFFAGAWPQLFRSRQDAAVIRIR